MSKIIVIDGMDGVGKSTQFNILKDKLEMCGYKVHTVHFPAYEDDSSYFVRKFLNGEIDNPNPYAVVMMYSLDRYLYLNGHPELKTVMQDAESNDIVLCDRYTTSTFMYQIAMLQAKDTYKITDGAQMAKFIYDTNHTLLGMPEPSLTLLLSASTEATTALAKERAKVTNVPLDTLEKDKALQDRINRNMSYILYYYNAIEIDCTSLSDSSKLLPADTIHELILEALRDKLFIEV